MKDERTAEFRSRTAALRVFRTPTGVYIQKSGHDWSAGDAERVAASHRLWSTALAETPGVSIPDARVDSDPPSVVMNYIAGDDLDSLTKIGADKPHHLLRLGIALAAYHTLAQRRGFSSPDVQISKWRRRLLLPPSVEQRARPVRTAGDFAPYNIRVGDNGELYILDPHIGDETVTLHRDLAWFLWWYRHDGGRHSDEFLSAYRRGAGLAFEADDYRLVWLYLCVMSMTRARKKLNLGDYRQAVRFTWWALSARAFAARGRRSFSL